MNVCATPAAVNASESARLESLKESSALVATRLVTSDRIARKRTDPDANGSGATGPRCAHASTRHVDSWRHRDHHPLAALVFDRRFRDPSIWSRYAATAGVNFPVFDWFRTLNTSRQYSQRAMQVLETRAVAERRFSQEYRSALARSSQFFEQIGQAREQMRLAEEDFKLSRIRYEGGEGAAVDVVVAQNQLVQARSSYYSSIANYLSAKLDLEVAAGR